MPRPATVPITRLRFRGHAATLKALCQYFHEHPREAFSAADLAEHTSRTFADVHRRLTETPELFSTLPKTPTTNTRFRLTLRAERMSSDEVAKFIADGTRSETRIAAAFISAFVGLFALVSVLSALY